MIERYPCKHCGLSHSKAFVPWKCIEAASRQQPIQVHSFGYCMTERVDEGEATMTDNHDGVTLTSATHPVLSEDSLEAIAIEIRAPRCEMAIPWSGEDGQPHRVSFHPKGYRDVMWCPYLNEPAILEWKDGKPHCVNCEGGFDAATHPFICHIEKKST